LHTDILGSIALIIGLAIVYRP